MHAPREATWSRWRHRSWHLAPAELGEVRVLGWTEVGWMGVLRLTADAVCGHEDNKDDRCCSDRRDDYDGAASWRRRRGRQAWRREWRMRRRRRRWIVDAEWVRAAIPVVHLRMYVALLGVRQADKHPVVVIGAHAARVAAAADATSIDQQLMALRRRHLQVRQGSVRKPSDIPGLQVSQISAPACVVDSGRVTHTVD